MSELSGQLAKQSITEVIRSIYLNRLSGVLEIEKGENRRRFFFVGGELHLSGTHTFAKKLAEFLETDRELRRQRARSAATTAELQQDLGRESRLDTSLDQELSAQAFRELERLVQRIADFLAEWRDGTFQFVDDLGAVPLDLVGPLPTAYLVMETAVRNRSEFEMLRSLGGEEAQVVANQGADALTGLYGVDPQEVFLLSRAEQTITMGELLRQSSLDRGATLEKLCRLRAVDLLRPVDEMPESEPEPNLQEDEAVIERFLERIGEELGSQPLDLDQAEHRTRLARLLEDLGGMTHYELLDVAFHARTEDVHAAYRKLARVVHPSHAVRLGLEGRDAAMRLLFERATEAYLALSDPERRTQYNQQAGIEAAKVQSPHQRHVERKEVARSSYERALELRDSEDFHFALELMRQAVRFDPRPEYYALMGEIQSKNPHWMRHASESYREAVKMRPDNADYRVALGQVLERLGDINRAKVHYRAALQRTPGHPGAIEAVNRLATEASSERGLFRTLKEWWGER